MRISDWSSDVCSSDLKSVAEKSGRSGRLAFVTVEHVVADAEGPCIVEEHDIVYREAGEKGAPQAGNPGAQGETPPPEGAWRQEVMPSPALLFRHSALPLNGHRINYAHPRPEDRPVWHECVSPCRSGWRPHH